MDQTKKAVSDDTAIFKAGFESMVNRKLGYVQKILIRAFLSPKSAINSLKKINNKFTKNKVVEIVKATNTHAIIRLHWSNNSDLTKDFCLLNKGMYQAFSTLWNLPPADLVERACYFRGGPYCEYELWWNKRSLFKLFFIKSSIKKDVFQSLIQEMERDKELIQSKYIQVKKLNDELHKKISDLMSLQEASHAMVSVLDEESLIENIMKLLTSVLNFSRAMLFLVDDKQDNLVFTKAVGELGDSMGILKDHKIPLDRTSNILVRIVSSGIPKFMNEQEIIRSLNDSIILRLFHPNNLSISPLIARNKVIGVLAGEMPSLNSEKACPDVNLLMTFANHIAIAIENARLYRDMEKTCISNLQSQKLQAVGTLTSGIAHDFNNILQAILGHANLLDMELEEGAEGAHRHFRIKEIIKSAKRASDLVKHLLTFSRKEEVCFRSIDLNKEIKSVKDLLSSTIPKMISIKLRLEPDLKPINADPVQINQIIMNLAVNARDAMRNHGTLMISTNNVNISESKNKEHSMLSAGEYIMLSIADTGHGMEKDVLDHIFEPFFTTKGMGQGTGLGLSTVYGIVNSHDGHIFCESNPGQGAIFRIYFKVMAQETQEIDNSTNGQDLIIRGGTEKLLIVDDEESIREYCRDLLTGYGYSVLMANSGEEAIDIYINEMKGIDLVVMDLIMHGMGGKNCFEKLMRIDPQVKVIMITGYALHNDIREAMEKGAKGLLIKPFRSHEIAGKIRKILDEAPTTPKNDFFHKKKASLRIVG